MTVRLSIEDEKSLSKALLAFSAGIALAFLCFMVLSVLLFMLVHWMIYGSGAESAHLFEHNAARVIEHPGYFFAVYGSWWNALLKGIRTLHPVPALFIPLLAPLLSLGALWYAFAGSSYSFSLWYTLNHHFAKLDDVRKMGLLKGILLVLGRFEGYILGLCRPASVLCLGETGCGKTTTVAIPSILRSDNISVAAMDNSGTLARHTSGYRSRLGPVFYFNWDLQDDSDKAAVYPRWNPLAAENLPRRGPVRDEYIKFLASYMVSAEGQVAKDNYWDWLASGALAAFIGFLAEKCAQAAANDYFLNRILENGRLSKDDKDILLSYYLLMPDEYSQPAIKNIDREKLTADDYFPIGSWGGIPSSWQGKDLCPGMLTDWLLKNYLTAKDENGSGDWRHWLEQLLAEAKLFNYGNAAVEGLQQFLYLSKQQRQLVFAYVLKPLRTFLNQGLRERTCGNDFKLSELRGIRNPETKKWEPVTVYSAANTKTSKFVSRMFIEVLLHYSVLSNHGQGALPLLMVFDDAGQMLKIRGLAESVAKGPLVRTSFLLLCNSLNAMERTYGRETLENLVANTSYKIVMAENSAKMSRQLDKLAIFATRSVQIPLDKRRLFSSKAHFADASYYHRLAKDLQVKKNLKVETRGYQLLLAEGYYHRPVLTSHIHFLRDEKFKRKAMLEASYFLDPQIFRRRNVQDIKVPRIDEVLYDVDLGIDDEVELAQYMNVVYDEVKRGVSEDAKIETVMINDISVKWAKTVTDGKSVRGGEQENWWMDERSFAADEAEVPQNPFAPKK